MKKISEYRVLSYWCEFELASFVELRIREGWQPFGGIAMEFVANDDRMRYAQAMVRYEEDGRVTGINRRK